LFARILAFYKKSTALPSHEKNQPAFGSHPVRFLSVLQYTQKSYRSCQFGLEAETGHFLCIRDILFLYHDDRYRSVPEDLLLNTSNDVEVWFRFVASVFRQYGLELLSNQPGLFDRLRAAQSKRDAEYVAAMDAESKKRHP
jgi:hypothetical protein